jgi:phosphoribosyl-ATP pyrophosphohydrolase/phosphoribosyl-AMP cyclohydrolase
MVLKYDDRGLIPAIVQDADTGQVLMMAWMNAEALAKTCETGEATFWSRSREELWHKGDTSGNVQRVEEIRYDCDGDTLLIRVHPAGPACHTGQVSCFYRELDESGQQPAANQQPCKPFTLQQLYNVICDRREHPKPGSYTTSLFAEGLPKIAQKVGEEANEVVVAALAEGDRRLVEEVADLTYHVLVLLAASGLSPGEVEAELAQRHQ